LVIQSTAQSSASLPTAHTCFNILDLPASYNSREQFQGKFLLALENCEGFGIV
jgi:ubiquitin-protein ligase E3 A